MNYEDARAVLRELEDADPHLRVFRVRIPGGTGSMPLQRSHPSVEDGPPSYITHDGQEFPL